MTEAQANTLIGAANSLGSKLIGSLPSQFLMLCIINLVFVLGLLWFLDRLTESRERLLTPLLTTCVQQVPESVLLKAMERPSR